MTYTLKNRLILNSLFIVASSSAVNVVAHGTMFSPVSRAYQCYLEGPESTTSAACQEAVKVGGKSALYNWSAVSQNAGGDDLAFVPDGQLCSGGNDSYRGFDLAREDWPKTEINTQADNNIDFSFRGTAPHATKRWTYYITKDDYRANTALKWSDLEPLCEFGTIALDNGLYHMSCEIPADKSGSHIIYSVWERSDSTETFYTCMDVAITGSSSSLPNDDDSDVIDTGNDSSNTDDDLESVDVDVVDVVDVVDENVNMETETETETETEDVALFDLAQIVAANDLTEGSKVILRLFDKNNTEQTMADLERFSFEISPNRGQKHQWTFDLANLVNSQSDYVRIGQLVAGDVVAIESTDKNRVYSEYENLHVVLEFENAPEVNEVFLEAVITASQNNVEGDATVTLSAAQSSGIDIQDVLFHWSIISGSADIISADAMSTELVFNGGDAGQIVEIQLEITTLGRTVNSAMIIEHQAVEVSEEYVPDTAENAAENEVDVNTTQGEVKVTGSSGGSLTLFSLLTLLSILFRRKF